MTIDYSPAAGGKAAGKDYMYSFKEVGTVPVDRVPDEHDEARDFEPSFWFWNHRYYLSDFTRVHNNPWLGDTSDVPDYIHGMEAECYFNPLYISVADGGDTVTLYTAVK